MMRFKFPPPLLTTVLFERREKLQFVISRRAKFPLQRKTSREETNVSSSFVVQKPINLKFNRKREKASDFGIEFSSSKTHDNRICRATR